MKRITAIAIVIAAVVGCSYVGTASAATCQQGLEGRIFITKYDHQSAMVWDDSTKSTMLDLCRVAASAKAADMSPADYERMRVSFSATAAGDGSDLRLSAEMVEAVSAMMDIGYYGRVQERK